MSLFRVSVLAVLCALVVSGCASLQTQPKVVPGYDAIQDGEFLIEPVPPQYLTGDQRRAEVDYAGSEAPGTIVVDTHVRKLYLVLEGGRAIRYPIAVGREGISFRGTGVVGRKAEWPSWTPTRNMIRTWPELYAAYAGGLSGGLKNPLGARALYLYRGGRDTMFRIHGTSDSASIGTASSAGCIRLFNQDIIDLSNRTPMGAVIKVRTQAESLALEGPQMVDAFGRVVPETPENIAKKEKDLAAIERQAQRDRAAAEAAEARRLEACRLRGIAVEDCPRLMPTSQVTVGTAESATSG